MNLKPSFTLFFPLMMLIAGLLGGGKAYIDQQLSHQLNHFIRQNAHSPLLGYQTISLSLLGDVVVTQLQLRIPNSDQLVEIEHLTLSQAYQFAWHQWEEFPALIKLNAEKITFTLPKIHSSVPILLTMLGYGHYYINSAELHQLGYGQVKADAQIILQVVDNQGQLDVQVDGENWGKLTFAAEMPSMPKPIDWEQYALQVSTVAVKYENKGLIEQLLSFLAQRSAIPLDIFKQTLINKINHDILQSGIRQETNVLTQLQQFFDTLTNITVYMYTNQPFALQRVVTMNPTELHLKITANEVN